MLVNTGFLQKRLPLTYGTSDYFRILICGYVWLLLWYVLLAIFPQPVSYLAQVLNEDVNDAKHFAVSTAALASAFTIRILNDLFVSPGTAEQLMAASNRKMERVLYRAARNGDLVMIVLKGGMVIICAPTIDPSHIARHKPEEISVIPIIIGHMEEGTGKLYLTTHYDTAYENLSPRERENHELTIAAAEILIAQIFNPKNPPYGSTELPTN